MKRIFERTARSGSQTSIGVTFIVFLMMISGQESFAQDQVAQTAGRNENYQSMLREYKQGKKDSAFLFLLADKAVQEKDKSGAAEIAKDYINLIKDPFSKINLEFIKQHTTKVSAPGFYLFNKFPKQVDEVLGEDAAAGVVKSVVYFDLINPMVKRKDITINWDSLEKKIVKQYGQPGEEIVWRARALYLYNNKQWEKFVIAANPYFEKYGYKLTGWEINNMAYAVFQHVNDRKLLEPALVWSRLSITLDPAPAYLDTYASLLYQLGKKDEGMHYQSMAVAKAPEGGKSDFESTLQKMKNGQPIK